MNKFIATFGANQPNEGHYILINAKTYGEAVKYMENNYPNKYCMVYTLNSWIEWAELARVEGFNIEKQLMEVDYDGK